MNKNILKIGVLGLAFLGVASCNKEPDESNLYTFTGETIESFIQKDSLLTSFNYILTRVGLDRMMASYGQYTCYAPTNDAVAAYIDSLYNDPEALVPHNSMTENSLEGLSDSLCNDIARYHLTNGLYSIIEMGGDGITISTMLGRPISSAVDHDENSATYGSTILNNVAAIYQRWHDSEGNEIKGYDIDAINGLLHIVDHVVPRTTRLIADELARHEEYSIFSKALEMTGLADSLLVSTKGKKYTIGDHSDTTGDQLYWPEECDVKFTLFAESDEVMGRNGIHSFEDLVAYANQVYGGSAEWYYYLGEKGITVSTGNDYTNRFNALNMFVAYHILYAGMAQDQLVFENKQGVVASVSKWNYVNGGEPYDYYETMLPNTLLKIWQPQPGRTLWINRYQTFNTLTNEVGTMGTNHTLMNTGIRINRDNQIIAYNGYIHDLNGMLVYDKQVPNGVLFERMRFESTTFLPEFINNGIRYKSMAEMSAMNGGGSGARVAFPLDYFDNVISYTDENQFRYNVKGDYRAYQADAFQGWGKYDFAVRIPPVPSGLYEFRLFYSPMGHGGMMQFYLGNSSNIQSMVALSIPLDVRIQETDPRIGWTPFYEEDDLGIATDEAMRNRGYMRGPVSFRGHPDGTGDMKTNNCRGDGVVTLRRILGRVDLKQSENYWFRIKNVISDETDLKWQIDFIELVPVQVVDNDTYSEDWY